MTDKKLNRNLTSPIAVIAGIIITSFIINYPQYIFKNFTPLTLLAVWIIVVIVILKSNWKALKEYD